MRNEQTPYKRLTTSVQIIQRKKDIVKHKTDQCIP